MKRTLIICLSIITIALVGCKKNENTWGKLEQGSVTVKVGETAQLTFNNNGNTHPQWSTDDAFVATVSSDGVVMGQHVGVTTVYVNNLSCTVVVTDRYEEEGYNIDEPFMDWDIDNSDVQRYEKEMRGEGLITLTNDSVIESFLDTTYIFNEDSTKWQIIVSEYDSVVYRYIKEGTYDYEMSAEDLMIDWAQYIYSYSKDSKTGEYSTYLKEYEYRVADKYEADMLQILRNRYFEMATTTYEAAFMYYDLYQPRYIVVKRGDDDRMYINFSRIFPE